jgi:hypothetical protein
VDIPLTSKRRKPWQKNQDHQQPNRLLRLALGQLQVPLSVLHCSLVLVQSLVMAQAALLAQASEHYLAGEHPTLFTH